jgi:hypothetical protein
MHSKHQLLQALVFNIMGTTSKLATLNLSQLNDLNATVLNLCLVSTSVRVSCFWLQDEG